MAEQQLALTLRWARELPVVDMACSGGWITELGCPTKDGGLEFKEALPARPGEHARAHSVEILPAAHDFRPQLCRRPMQFAQHHPQKRSPP